MPPSWQEGDVKAVGVTEPVLIDDDSLGKTSKKDLLISMSGLVGVIVFVLVIIWVGYIYRVQKTIDSDSIKVARKEQISISPTPSVVENKALVFKVLNASGKSGAAAKMAVSLKALGIDIGEVGNFEGVLVGNKLNLVSGELLSDELNSKLKEAGFYPFVVGVASGVENELIIGK